jgi:hypothetical protein
MSDSPSPWHSARELLTASPSLPQPSPVPRVLDPDVRDIYKDADLTVHHAAAFYMTRDIAKHRLFKVETAPGIDLLTQKPLMLVSWTDQAWRDKQSELVRLREQLELGAGGADPEVAQYAAPSSAELDEDASSEESPFITQFRLEFEDKEAERELLRQSELRRSRRELFSIPLDVSLVDASHEPAHSSVTVDSPLARAEAEYLMEQEDPDYADAYFDALDPFTGGVDFKELDRSLRRTQKRRRGERASPDEEVDEEEKNLDFKRPRATAAAPTAFASSVRAFTRLYGSGGGSPTVSQTPIQPDEEMKEYSRASIGRSSDENEMKQ